MSSTIKSDNLSNLVAFRVGQVGNAATLANILGVHRSYITNLLSGKRTNPSKHILELLGIREKTVYELIDPGDVDLHHKMREIVEAQHLCMKQGVQYEIKYRED